MNNQLVSYGRGLGMFVQLDLDSCISWWKPKSLLLPDLSTCL